MIATTYQCGCPIPLSLIELVRPRCASCSSCCSRRTEADRQKISCRRDRQKKVCTDAERVVSEIAKKGQPYKEIEAVINNNRVIVRMHKEPAMEDHDPPCECIGQRVYEKTSAINLTKGDDDVAFKMAEGTLELQRVPRPPSPVENGELCEQAGCRTVTLYPQAGDGEPPPALKPGERPIDLEKNPNIFVLRIRKYSENNDKKQKIDLEFRTPRPWRKDSRKDESPVTEIEPKTEQMKRRKSYLESGN